MRIIFLGMNPAGEKVYDWLNQREEVEVLALLTEKGQLPLIEELDPELVISSGFEYKVPEKFIEVPEKGIVNLHPSYLPYNRGSHPFIWPIIENTPAGVSIHYMNENIDEGDVIAKKEVRIEPDDTSKNLYDRLMFEQFEFFKQNWKKIKEGANGTSQNLNAGNRHLKSDLDEVSKLDLDEELEAGELIDLLRGLSFSEEGDAYFERNGERYYVSIDITPEN